MRLTSLVERYTVIWSSSRSMASRTSWADSAAPGVPNDRTTSKVVAMAGRENRSSEASGPSSVGLEMVRRSRVQENWPAVRARFRGRKNSRRFMGNTTCALLIVLVDHRLKLLGIALDGQDDGSFLDAVGGGGHGRDDLPAIGQAKAHGKGAIRPELD